MKGTEPANVKFLGSLIFHHISLSDIPCSHHIPTTATYLPGWLPVLQLLQTSTRWFCRTVPEAHSVMYILSHSLVSTHYLWYRAWPSGGKMLSKSHKIELTQNTPVPWHPHPKMELLMEDLGIWGLGVMDWCAETTAVSPEDIVSFHWAMYLEMTIPVYSICCRPLNNN